MLERGLRFNAVRLERRKSGLLVSVQISAADDASMLSGLNAGNQARLIELV